MLPHQRSHQDGPHGSGRLWQGLRFEDEHAVTIQRVSDSLSVDDQDPYLRVILCATTLMPASPAEIAAIPEIDYRRQRCPNGGIRLALIHVDESADSDILVFGTEELIPSAQVFLTN